MFKKAHQMVCCCKIEALVSVDGRGQIVLPKELRDKVGIKAGDKLAVIGWGEDCCHCLCLVKADELNEMAQNMFGPMMKGKIK